MDQMNASPQDIMLAAALIVGIATLCQIAAPFLRVPSLVLLLPAGFLLGLVAPQFSMDQILGPAFPVAVDLMVALILFQGGLELGSIKLQGADRGVVHRLIWIGAPMTWLIGSALALGVLLIGKLFPRFSRLGNVPMGYLVGAGAAVAIGGAILGTLFGQATGTIQAFEMNGSVNADSAPLAHMVSALVGFVGTVATLAYFQFGTLTKGKRTGKRPLWLEGAAGIGKIFIAITLGAVFAGVLTASITALVERVVFIRDFFQLFL